MTRPDGRQVVVGRDDLGLPLLVRRVEDRGQPVGGRLVGPEDAEVPLVLVELDHVAEELAERARCPRPSTSPGAGTSIA